MKSFVFFIALTISIFFINDKFSKAVRVIAFNEDESKTGAILSFIMMFLVAFIWTIFFAMIKIS